MTEAEILRDVHAWLASQPDVYVRRNNTGRLRDERGAYVVFGLGVGGPDLVGSVLMPWGAQSIGVECKSPRGIVSEQQKAWMSGAERMGWRCCVVRSVDDVKSFLADVRQGCGDQR